MNLLTRRAIVGRKRMGEDNLVRPSIKKVKGKMLYLFRNAS